MHGPLQYLVMFCFCACKLLTAEHLPFFLSLSEGVNHCRSMHLHVLSIVRKFWRCQLPNFSIQQQVQGAGFSPRTVFRLIARDVVSLSLWRHLEQKFSFSSSGSLASNEPLPVKLSVSLEGSSNDDTIVYDWKVNFNASWLSAAFVRVIFCV